MDISQPAAILLERAQANYPEWVCEWRSNVSAQIMDLVDVLAQLYWAQNQHIHELCSKQQPWLTLAESETCWTIQGRPKQFFAQELAEHPEHVSPLLQLENEVRLGVWKLFVSLLMLSEHAGQVRNQVGHTPNQVELLNEAWDEWNERLRERFGPILDGEGYHV